MKLYLSDKMLVTWLLISGLTEFSDAVLLSGIAGTIRYYTELFQGSYTNMSTAEFPEENINHRFSPSSFKTDSGNPKTLEAYLTDQHDAKDIHDHGSDQILNVQSSGKVTLVSKIGDYDEESKGNRSWITPSELLIKNQSIENPTGNDTVELLGKDAEHSDNSETQKYIDHYQELFYKFKEFVNTGINPDINRTNSEKTSLNNNDEKKINVTYILPIPNTTKYFEISISNVSVTQYDVINMFVMEHMKNKTKTFSTNRENEIVYIDIGDERKQVTSRDLTETESQSTPTLNSTTSQMPTNPDQAIAYFHSLFNEKDYGDLLEIIKSKHSNISEFKAEKTNFTRTNKLPLIKNNGYHAEISTDYIHKKYDVQENKNLSVNSSIPDNNNSHESIDQQNQPEEQERQVNKSVIGTATTVLTPVYIRRNITKLLLRPHSKLPFPYNSSTVRQGLNPQRRKTNLNNFDAKVPSLHTPRPQLAVNVLEPQPVETATPSTVLTATPSTVLTDQKIVNEVSIPQTANNTDFNVTSSVPTVENLTTLMNPSMVMQDWMDISELYKNTMNENVLLSVPNLPPPSDGGMIDDASVPQDTASVSVLQAANWILGMKKRLEEEERNKTERYKDYIKQYLGGEGDSVYLGKKEDGSSVMKINKEDNTLEELKNLMMSYFTVMNFTDKKGTAGNSFLEVESIKNATNIFELMEMSSQLVKFNLQMKKQTNSKEPSGFVKRVVESQVEKCTRIFNNSLSSIDKQTKSVLLKKSSRRYMVFTNCMNFKLQKCIKEFSIWLEKGRYYLRRQFRLSRAYENYEIERNLYCLRTYNASTLDSNRHGVRVRPRYKGNRKPPMNRAQGKSKTRIQIRKLSSREDKVKNGRKAQINRKYNNRQTNSQNRREKSRVQYKYNSRQQITARRQNRERKQNKTMKQSQLDSADD